MQLTHQLAAAVDSVRGALCKHMRREELEVLPLLQAHLCDAEQRSIIWRMLRAMPLRLLTKVMPVVAGTCLEAVHLMVLFLLCIVYSTTCIVLTHTSFHLNPLAL